MRFPPQIVLPLPNGPSRALDLKLSGVVWILLVGALLLATLSKESLLPNYFFFDAGTIDTFIALGAKLTPADSYSSTAAVYGAFGFRRWSTMLPVTGVIVTYALLRAIWAGRSLRAHELAIFVFFSFLSVVYMTTLSKDFIVLLLVLAFSTLSGKGSRIGLILWMALALIYGYYFRTYWFLVIAEFIVLRVLLARFRKPLYVIPIILVSLLAIAVMLQVKLGVDADSFRTIVNDTRGDDTHANTMIVPFLNGGGFLIGYLNVCITLATLIVPLPLLTSFSPYYIAIFLFLSTLQYGFWKSFAKAIKHGKHRYLADCSCLIASFLVIQSLFEPDYGSYVRHLAPFYPLLFYTWLHADQIAAE